MKFYFAQCILLESKTINKNIVYDIKRFFKKSRELMSICKNQTNYKIEDYKKQNSIIENIRNYRHRINRW